METLRIFTQILHPDNCYAQNLSFFARHTTSVKFLATCLEGLISKSFREGFFTFFDLIRSALPGIIYIMMLSVPMFEQRQERKCCIFSKSSVTKFCILTTGSGTLISYTRSFFAVLQYSQHSHHLLSLKAYRTKVNET